MTARLLGLALLLALSACTGSGAVGSTTTGSETQPAGGRDAAGNLTSGPGWELLAFTRSGLTYGVAVAENEMDAERMWAALPFDLAAPPVDYNTHVLMVLGHAVSGSCPEIQFQSLAIEPDRVYGEFTFVNDDEACTADANPAAYLLAVERVALPDRFLLTLEAEDICGGCDEDTILVDLTSDQPDGSQWWATANFGVVIGGAPPEDSHVFTLRFGAVIEPLAIPTGDWQIEPRWVGGGERIPNRVEAFTANCLGGEECIEDLDLLEPTGPVCGANVQAEPRQDVMVMITFADDGSCAVEVVPGTDGTEFMAGSDEPEG
jgi:hypothetical protein